MMMQYMHNERSQVAEMAFVSDRSRLGHHLSRQYEFYLVLHHSSRLRNSESHPLSRSLANMHSSVIRSYDLDHRD